MHMVMTGGRLAFLGSRLLKHQVQANLDVGLCLGQRWQACGWDRELVARESELLMVTPGSSLILHLPFYLTLSQTLQHSHGAGVSIA